MKIVWLEDEPETITIVQNKIEEFCTDIEICKSFASFSDALEDLEDIKSNVIIIDIRMFFNKESEFTCFKSIFTIKEPHDSGFEYFNKCIKEHIHNAQIIFFSSKPEKEAHDDASKHGIDMHMIISKDYTTRLIKLLKELK